MSGKVLLIANNFPPVRGGSAVVYDNVARASVGRIDVLAPRLSYADGMPLIGWREHDRRAPYRVRRIRLLRTLLGHAPRSRWQRARLLASELAIRLAVGAAVVWLVRRGRHRAVCLGELLASGWLIRPLRRFLSLRVILYVHGEEITTRDPYDPQKRRCRQRLQDADGIVVVSRFTEAAVLDLLGREAAGKVILIGNGVAASRFTPGPKRPDLLAQYGLAGAFVFVSVCRLLEKKGLDNALRAFAAIASVGEAVPSRFLVVGSGPYEAALVALAEQLGIADRVAFTGLVPEGDLIELYRLGDVFVMPNRELLNGDTEGFGLVFLEANACGLPVIAGRDGGSTDAVQDGVNGLVVDGKSVPEIATAMRRLRDEPELREGLRGGGLARAAEAAWEPKVEVLLDFCAEGRARDAPG